MFDLQLNYPRLGIEGALLADYLRTLRSSAFTDSLQPRPATGTGADREAGAAFLAKLGLHVPAENVFLVSGGHHAIAMILSLAQLHGTAIAVDTISYPFFLTMARDRGILLLACASDSDGMTPAALEAAIAGGARAVYLMPTVHNPLGTVMTATRRKQIADLAVKANICIIEDDAYAFLEAAPPPPIASSAPEQTFYIHSFSKPFAPGLKVGLLAVPTHFAPEVEQAVLLSSSGTAPLFSGFLTHLLETGALESLLAAKRAEAAVRQKFARSILTACTITSHSTSFHLWIAPERISAAELCARAFEKGVQLSPGEAFASSTNHLPNAFRIALGGETDRQRMEQALHIIGTLLLAA